jgi:hypothetical protein
MVLLLLAAAEETPTGWPEAAVLISMILVLGLVIALMFRS